MYAEPVLKGLRARGFTGDLFVIPAGEEHKTREEKARIDARIAMTGMDKAEFFIESCLYQAILVRGNVRTFREFEREMKELALQIERNVKLEDMDPGQQESLRVILEVLEKLFGKER